VGSFKKKFSEFLEGLSENGPLILIFKRGLIDAESVQNAQEGMHDNFKVDVSKISDFYRESMTL